jgi:hypothetical protein
MNVGEQRQASGDTGFAVARGWGREDCVGEILGCRRNGWVVGGGWGETGRGILFGHFDELRETSFPQSRGLRRKVPMSGVGNGNSDRSNVAARVRNFR